MGVVGTITYAPVKGLALVRVDGVELAPEGVRGNRRFHLIGDDGRLVNGKTVGKLVQLVADGDADGTSLSIRFPDGAVVGAEVEVGEPTVTSFYGRPVPGHLVQGPFSDAVSAFAGQVLRLVRVDEPGDGCDRGPDGSVSIVSRAGLDALAREAGIEHVDGRRFRMLFEVEGVAPHEEDAWLGRRVAIGNAVMQVRALAGRCAVTSQSPDTGIRDLDTLGTIRRYRPQIEGEEPLPIGVWGSVEQPGRVRIGDPVEPL